MPKFTIPRSGAAPLAFSGSPIHESSTELPGLKRWHELTIYQREPPADGFVAHLEYQTRWERETPQSHVLVAKDARDLAFQLAQYASGTLPFVGMTGFPPGGQFEAKRQHIEREMRLRLQAAVSEILGRIPDATETL